jgi:multisubunit Na+/H+ antiporter MnhB subunit
MNARELLLTPRGFLIAGGAVLLVLGILGFFVLNNPTLSFFWLDTSENIAHIALGAVALAAVYVPGLNDTLRPYYRWIVILVGLIALFFGVYGFLVAGNDSGKNTFGLSNLELGDNLLHLVVAVWAFAAALMTSRESMTASR